MRGRIWALCGLLMAVAACSDGSGNAAPAGSLLGNGHEDSYTQQLETWRQARLAALRAPDGWLSYTGSDACARAATRSAPPPTATSACLPDPRG